MWQGCEEDGGDLTATKIPCREDEYPHVTCSQRAYLQRAVSEALILCEHNPAALSYGLLAADGFFDRTDLQTEVYAKRPVDKEYRPVRRLPAQDPRPNRRPCIARKWM